MWKIRRWLLNQLKHSRWIVVWPISEKCFCIFLQRMCIETENHITDWKGKNVMINSEKKTTTNKHRTMNEWGKSVQTHSKPFKIFSIFHKVVCNLRYRARFAWMHSSIRGTNTYWVFLVVVVVVVVESVKCFASCSACTTLSKLMKSAICDLADSHFCV